MKIPSHIENIKDDATRRAFKWMVEQLDSHDKAIKQIQTGGVAGGTGANPNVPVNQNVQIRIIPPAGGQPD